MPPSRHTTLFVCHLRQAHCLHLSCCTPLGSAVPLLHCNAFALAAVCTAHLDSSGHVSLIRRPWHWTRSRSTECSEHSRCRCHVCLSISFSSFSPRHWLVISLPLRWLVVCLPCERIVALHLCALLVWGVVARPMPLTAVHLPVSLSLTDWLHSVSIIGGGGDQSADSLGSPHQML